MTKKELISLLDQFEDDEEIVVRPTNTDYVYSLSSIESQHHIRTFYGEDFKANVLTCSTQIGADWGEDEE